MKRTFKIGLLMMVLLFALGCGKKEVSKERVYGFFDGFFAKEGLVEDGLPVILHDANCNQRFIACSIMNCEHLEDSEECEAYIEGRMYTIIYDGKMYYFCSVYGYITDVWVKELSGSGRTKVTTIPYHYEKRYFLLYDGKLYFGATEAIDADKTEESLPFLVEFDLNTYEHRKITEGEQHDQYEDYKYDKIEILDGELYYEFNAYMPDYHELHQEAMTGDNILEDLEEAEKLRDYCVCKVNLDTLEKTQLFTGEDFERYEFMGLSGDYLIFYDTETNGAVRMDSSGVMETLVTPEGLEVWEFSVGNIVMGDYIVTYNYKDNTVSFISVKDGTKLKRDQKESEPVPLVYNEAIDAVYAIDRTTGKQRRCIISVKDLISGNFE